VMEYVPGGDLAEKIKNIKKMEENQMTFNSMADLHQEVQKMLLSKVYK